MLNAIEEIIDKGNILGSVQVSQIANYELDNSLIKSKAHELFDDPLINTIYQNVLYYICILYQECMCFLHSGID